VTVGFSSLYPLFQSNLFSCILSTHPKLKSHFVKLIMLPILAINYMDQGGQNLTKGVISEVYFIPKYKFQINFPVIIIDGINPLIRII